MAPRWPSSLPGAAWQPGGRASLRDDDALHEALPVDRGEARVSLGLLLFLHDPHIRRVDRDTIIIEPQILLDHPPRGVELVLVRAPLDGREPVKLLRVFLEGFGSLDEHFASVFPGQLEDDDVDHPGDPPIRLPDQRRLALHEFLGEVCQGLVGPGAPVAGLDLVLLQELVQLLLLQPDRRVDEGREVLVLTVGPQPDALRLAPCLSHPLEDSHLLAMLELELGAPAHEAQALQHRLIGRQNLPANHLLPVHGLDAGVGRRVLGLLERLDRRRAPPDLAVAHAHHVFG
mmetsp:Transcript_2413/g.5113  ORF Transcript_2413/g.5113 Transcript_2413/m.5113 type:complete len:288 (-) Transcript_2413:1583-2446(-)